MKRILLFLMGFFILSQSYSQDRELFKTWYLYSINLEGQQEPYNIWEVEPSISPTLTITENLEFSGEGACNTFDGQYSYQYELLFIDNFNPTEYTCDFQSHTQFESYYFSFFMEGSDTQISLLSETTLILESPIFMSMQFSSYPLGISDNTAADVKIYPNPTSDKLNISLEKAKFEKFRIYSITGEKVLEEINIGNEIDVSSLSKGMYFLEIITSEGINIQKFIKN